MPIYINQTRGKLVTRIAANSTNGGTETIQLTTANTTADETVTAMHISKVYWSGNVVIGRGDAGGTLLFNLTGDGKWDFDIIGITQIEEPTTNVVITCANNATVYVELRKQSTLA